MSPPLRNQPDRLRAAIQEEGIRIASRARPYSLVARQPGAHAAQLVATCRSTLPTM